MKAAPLPFVLSLIALAGVLSGNPATAETFLVFTQGQTAQRLPSGGFAHAVDWDTKQATPGTLVSESRVDTNWVASPDGSMLFGRSLGHYGQNGQDRFSPIALSTETLSAKTFGFNQDTTTVAFFHGYDPESETTMACRVIRKANEGYLVYSVYDRDIRVPLAGLPVRIIPAADSTSVAIVLNRPNEGDFALQFCSLTGSRRVSKAISLPSSEGKYRVEVDTSALLNDGTTLLLGLSGYSLNEDSSERKAWVECWNWDTQKPIGTPIPVEGTWEADGLGLIATQDRNCWAITHTPGRSFAFANLLTLIGDQIEAGRLLTFTGVNGSVKLAPSPTTSREVAFAVGQSILVYDQDIQRRDQFTFDAPVTALTWRPEGIFVALGDKLVQLNDDGEITDSLSIPTGQIVDILPHPKSSGFSTESVPTPTQRIVTDLHFGDTNSGRQRFSVGPPGTVLMKETLPPWVIATQDSRRNPGVMIEPQAVGFSDQVPETTTITARLPLADDLNSTQTRITFSVTVGRTETPTPSVLWLRDPADLNNSITDRDHPNRFSRLIEHLSEYPNLFLHEELAEPRNIDLSPFIAIVLTSATAEFGIFTRQEMLDYVAGGGTIVYLAGNPPADASKEAGRWLDAVGIRRATMEPVNGDFVSEISSGFSRHAKQLSIRNGSQLYSNNIDSILVSGNEEPESAIVAQRSYGLGRIMVFASSTPFENDALQTPHGLRFAESVFDWVRNQGSGVEDFDQDGIPDRIEDPNGNQLQDSGETHYARADSDGDGILDGLEDINQNGFVDDIETHPLLSDTDGDGIPDAADANPLPPAGTPYIASVTPDYMPAEGSRPVIITGRNFSPASEIWFGNRKSPNIRVLNRTQVEAMVPPLAPDSPTSTALEIRNADFTVSSSLEQGFRYTRRSSTSLVARSVKTIREQYGIYSLQTKIILPPSDVQISNISFVLEIEPESALEHLEIVPGEFGHGRGAEPMNVRDLGTGQKLITLANRGNFTHGATLFDIQWRLNMLEEESGTAIVRLTNQTLRTPQDGLLKSELKTELYYDFRATPLIPLFDE